MLDSIATKTHRFHFTNQNPSQTLFSCLVYHYTLLIAIFCLNQTQQTINQPNQTKLCLCLCVSVRVLLSQEEDDDGVGLGSRSANHRLFSWELAANPRYCSGFHQWHSCYHCIFSGVFSFAHPILFVYWLCQALDVKVFSFICLLMRNVVHMFVLVLNRIEQNLDSLYLNFVLCLVFNEEYKRMNGSGILQGLALTV